MRSSFLPDVKIKINNAPSCRALIDTGDCANVISNRLLQEITEIDKNVVKLQQPGCTSIKMAGGQLVRIEKQVEIKFELAHREFVEDYLVLSSSNSVILGNPFFIEYSLFQLAQKKALFNSPI